MTDSGGVSGKRHLFLLCWICFLFVAGISVFTSGFLLKRQVIRANSTCSQGVNQHFSTLNIALKVNELLNFNGNSTCWLPKKYSKAVIIVLDGLRYDFATYNESLSATEALPFQNKLSILHELLKKEPNRAALFKFIADPPTTTMQRLKGLITGSLPTFIDASDNFASFEINEDNIIDQLVMHERKVKFMGDDTWMGLLPQRFFKSFPFPSFNVKDLHTVDNGILDNLIPELQKKDWDVLIAHFLGVDHCGHRYGPNHDAMAAKLLQMNEMIKSVINSLDLNTLLVIMGDHGMTREGDHGGDSTDEINSALFLYSKNILWQNKMTSLQEVSQIDFPPTFALLMEIPVPFGNLGTVVDDLFIFDGDRPRSLPVSTSKDISNDIDLPTLLYGTLALYSNAKQVETYLEHYSTVSQEIFLEEHQFNILQQQINSVDDAWRNLLSSANRTHQLLFIKQESRAYLTTVKAICRKLWAQFNISAIIIGIVITGCAFVTVAMQFLNQSQTSLKIASVLFVIAICGIASLVHTKYPLLRVFQGNELVVVVALVATSELLYVTSSFRNSTFLCLDFSTTGSEKSSIPSIIAVLGATFLFSNSYVVSEDSLTSYFALSVLWWEVLSHHCDAQTAEIKQKSKVEQIFHKNRLTLIAYAAISTICVRLQKVFWKCREEQWWCEGSDFSRSLGNIPTSTAEYISYKNWRFFTSVSSVWLVVLALRWVLQKAGNANGFLPAVLCSSYSPICIGICVSFYWALQGLTTTLINELFSQYLIFLPNAVFLFVIASVLLFFYRPLCVYAVQQETEEIGPILSSNEGEVLHQVYRHLKLNWRKHLLSSKASLEAEKKPLLVYGLASVFSATLIGVSNIIILTLMLLGGDGYAGAFLLTFISLSSFVQCLASLSYNSSKNPNDLLKVPWSWVLVWSFLASIGFYATGHQQAFPAIHWEAAVLGTDGNFHSHILPAVKVVLNTFSSQILAGFCLPILFLWPITSRVIFGPQNYIPPDADDNLKRGEFYLFDNQNFFNGLYDLVCKYLTIQGLRLLCSMAAAALLRRHLMVWKIFAPRFIFEALSFVVSIPVILLTFILMMSVQAALASWLNNLNKHEHMH